VEAHAVSVTLGRARVLSEVSAKIERGEWVAVIGPNGAGKTTILRAIAGLLAFGGRVLVEGRAVSSSTRRQLARQIALVPQQPQTPPELTVAEYVLLGRTPHIGHLATEARPDRVAERASRGWLCVRSAIARSVP
jgi:iron complex transport system ATP-binding protein